MVAPHETHSRGASDRSLARTREDGASRRTVMIALAANAVIAVTKLAGGLISGSTALLAEAAHSLADTANQSFLLVSIALAGRDPDDTRPFGHGQQRFLWTFLAAVAMFVAGALFAIGYGIVELLAGAEKEAAFAIAWITLAIAFASEGSSWLRATRHLRAEAREAGEPLLRHARASRDPSLKMVLFEDSAALVGIALAAAGIGLHQLTGESFWDPLASIMIGLLLIAVAVWIARDSGRMLTGVAARPAERAAIERVLEEHDGIERVLELLTLVLGPRSLLVAARVDLSDRITGERVEQMADELDEAIRLAVPDATEVFLDATARAEHVR